MDADLEDELMDLATNESAYLPQAVHSRVPLEVPNLDRGTSLHERKPLTLKGHLPMALGESVGSRTAPLLPAPHPNTPTPPPPSDFVAGKAPHNGSMTLSEEPLGWYDQLEMVLAVAEAKYYEWVEDMDTQGSLTEEDYRRAEAERVARRSVTIAQLKAERRAIVQAKVDESNIARSLNTNTHDVVVNVDKMMDRLAYIVDESAKLLQAQRKEAVWIRLAEDLPQTERDYVAKGADEMFREKLKYKRDPEETHQLIEQHIKEMFRVQTPTRNGHSVGRTMNHSLASVLREFADIFHYCYADDAVKIAVAHGELGSMLILPLVAADINDFSFILVQIIHYKYPELPRSWSEPLVHRCVIDALFDHLQPTLHLLYATAFDQENRFVKSHAERLRSSTLESLGVSSVFRLDGSWQPKDSFESKFRDTNELMLQSLRQYEPLIRQMNALPTHRSPWVKAAIIAGISKDIDRIVKEYYARRAADTQPAPAPDEINVTADDLAAILAFLVIASPAVCSHLPTQLALLGSFMASESAMGEQGFAIATFWTAVNHICHIV